MRSWGRHQPDHPQDRQSARVCTPGSLHNDRLLDALMLQAQSALRASPGVRAYYDKQVRHEALDVRGEVEDLRRLAVAAAGLKLGAA